MAALPDSLKNGGSVMFRQTTFWDVAGQDARQYHIRFIHKMEFSFVESDFDRASLMTEHPILLDHQEPFDSLFISSRVYDPDVVLEELESIAEEHFHKWRPLTRYLNSAYPPRQLLLDGFGLLLKRQDPLQTFVLHCFVVRAFV